MSLVAWFFRYQPVVVPLQREASPIAAKIVNILLVPAGDARNNGRGVVHQFESGCTSQLVQELKNELERSNSSVRVLCSHGQGEILQPWHVATMANTLDIDIVLNFHCYHEQGPKPTMTIYEFSYGQDFVNKLTDMSWYGAHQAYLFATQTTGAWASMLVDELTKPPLTTLFAVAGPFKIPFKPLLGVKVPAFGIELSLKDDNGYKEMINPLAQAMSPVFDQLIKQRTVQVVS